MKLPFNKCNKTFAFLIVGIENQSMKETAMNWREMPKLPHTNRVCVFRLFFLHSHVAWLCTWFVICLIRMGVIYTRLIAIRMVVNTWKEINCHNTEIRGQRHRHGVVMKWAKPTDNKKIMLFSSLSLFLFLSFFLLGIEFIRKIYLKKKYVYKSNYRPMHRQLKHHTEICKAKQKTHQVIWRLITYFLFYLNRSKAARICVLWSLSRFNGLFANVFPCSMTFYL